MTDILGTMDYIARQGEAGRQQGQQTRMGELYAQAMQAPPDQRQGLLAQIARMSPDAAMGVQKSLTGMDADGHAAMAQEANQFLAVKDMGDPASTQQAYARLVQHARALGFPVPDQYDDRFLPGIQKLAGAVGPSGAVQSTYIDAQGQRVAIMRDGTIRPLGMNAPNNQIIDTGNGFYGVNKGNLSAAPVMIGGQPQQQAPAMQFVGADGHPVQIDPSLPPDVQASIRANEGAFAAAPDGAMAQIGPQGQQLRSAPKPMTPAQQLQMQLEQARFGLAQRADQRDAARLQLAQQAANQPKPADQAKAEKLAAARSDALDSVNQAIDGIDTLQRSGGFANLGTFTGDVLGHIPHTQTRDAQAALDTVKNQVLLTTLGKLKALSATGASGFGALSNQEGKILQNSIANLETAQSHDAIVHNLQVIRHTLQRAAGLIGQGGAPGPAAPSAPAAGGWSIQKVGP